MDDPAYAPDEGPDSLEDYYQYLPSVGANSFFMVSFFLFAAFFLYRAVRLRLYVTLVMCAFAAWEGAGYLTRLLFALDTGDYWNRFLAQLIILIIAPNLVQAFLYACFSKLVLAAPIESTSILIRRAKWLPYIFIVSDLACLIVQSIGGAQLADDTLTESQQQVARRIMLAGLGAQLACLAVFLAIVWWFFSLCPKALLQRVRVVVGALTATVALVALRNCFRMAEFSEGSFTEGHLSEREIYYFLGDAIPMWLVCAICVAVRMEDSSMITNRLKDVDAGQHKPGAAQEEPV